MDAVNLAEYLFKTLRQREQNAVDIIAWWQYKIDGRLQIPYGRVVGDSLTHTRFTRNAAYG